MQKSKKTFLGLLGLALVALMTLVAHYLPTSGAYAEGTNVGTDTIQVTVYNRFPSLKIDGPETGYGTALPTLPVTFTYENAQYVDFSISYNELDEEGNIRVDDEGNPIVTTIALPRFNPDPERLDPVFKFDSDTQTVTINLDDYNLGYGHYILTASADSPVGKPADDMIEFDRAPVQLVQTGSDDGTNDPIADVIYDDGAAMVELMPLDENGNPLFDKPIVIKVTPDPDTGEYLAGSQPVSFPFASYGLPTGDYDILVTAYSATVTPGQIDPETGEQGEDTVEYTVISSPHNIYTLSYVQPPAPDVPNTGRFLGNLNLASSDIIITSVIAFAGCAAVAFILIGRRKKDYRKNIRGRK